MTGSKGFKWMEKKTVIFVCLSSRKLGWHIVKYEEIVSAKIHLHTHSHALSGCFNDLIICIPDVAVSALHTAERGVSAIMWHGRNKGKEMLILDRNTINTNT